MTLLGLFGGIELIFLLILLLFVFLLPLIALIDVVRNEFEGNNKIVWVLVIIFFNILGTLLYFAIGRGQRVKSIK